MDTVKRLLSPAAGIAIFVTVFAFATLLIVHLTIMSPRYWKDAATSVLRLDLFAVLTESEFVQATAAAQGVEFPETYEDVAREVGALLPFLQPTLDAYTEAVIDGYWDYLVGDDSGITVNEAALATQLASAIDDFAAAVQRVRAGEATDSEIVRELAGLPAEQYAAMMAEMDAYLELLVQSLGAMTPATGLPMLTAADAVVEFPASQDMVDFRRVFQDARSELWQRLLMSGAILVAAIGVYYYANAGTNRPFKRVGGALLWYSIPGAIILGLVVGAFPLYRRLAAAFTDQVSSTDRPAWELLVLLLEHADGIMLTLFFPAIAVVGVCLGIGIALKIIAAQLPSADGPSAPRPTY